MDPQQAADAGLKAAGLSYAAYALFDGPLDDRALLASDAGRASLVWYVASDVVLPFADNFVSGGMDIITELIDKQAAQNVERLAMIAGPDVQEAAVVLTRLGDTFKTYAGQAAAFASPISAYAKDFLPGMLGTADRVTGVAATAVEALAAYRALAASLAAEVVLAKALADVRLEVERELEAAEAAWRRPKPRTRGSPPKKSAIASPRRKPRARMPRWPLARRAAKTKATRWMKRRPRPR